MGGEGRKGGRKRGREGIRERERNKHTAEKRKSYSINLPKKCLTVPKRRAKSGSRSS